MVSQSTTALRLGFDGSLNIPYIPLHEHVTGRVRQIIWFVYLVYRHREYGCLDNHIPYVYSSMVICCAIETTLHAAVNGEGAARVKLRPLSV